ncbi:MAG: hypothetical protein ACC707_02420 [Thiohalomonadales bacterium]
MQALDNSDHEQPLLVIFADAQLAAVVDKTPGENLLLEVVVSAFFYGALEMLDKQSTDAIPQTRSFLVEILMSCCKIPKSSALSIVHTIDKLSEKNSLVEHLMQQGSDAVEQWLACDPAADDTLARLVEQYRGRTLREFGIEGIGVRYEAQQKLLYLRLDDSVERIHRRSKVLLFLIMNLALISIAYSVWAVYFR